MKYNIKGVTFDLYKIYLDKFLPLLDLVYYSELLMSCENKNKIKIHRIFCDVRSL